MKLLICVAIFALYSVTEGCERLYTCLDDQTVNILGANLTCQNNEVCNEFNSGTACAPCVDPNHKCEKLFTCSGDEVNLGGAILNCPTDSHCNEEGKGNCAICVPDTCPGKKIYECGSEPNEVLYRGVVITCRTGMICNNDFIKPCGICIPQRTRSFSF